MSLTNVFKKIFGTKADRDMKAIKPTLDKVLEAYKVIDPLSDDELRERCQALKDRIQAEIAADEARIAEIKEELEKDYHLVVLDYDLNHDEEVLKELEPYAGKLEILVNEICYPHCPMRSQHYRDESRAQLQMDTLSRFNCPNKSTPRVFEESKKRPAFISNEEIGSYIERGYVNFKIVGRGLPPQFVLDSYLYFLVKDEERSFIEKQIKTVLAPMFK